MVIAVALAEQNDQEGYLAAHAVLGLRGRKGGNAQALSCRHPLSE